MAAAASAPKAKRVRTAPKEESEGSAVKTVIAQFRDTAGTVAGPQLALPVGATREQLENLLNNLLRNEEKLPYSFFLDDSEIVESLAASLAEHEAPASETVLAIVYQPQAVFRVQVVTRCSSTLPGHSEAILHVHFSPDGKRLASASGDGTVRLWELGSQMPERTLSGHRNWVLAVAWAPNARKLASGSMDGDIRVWDPDSGKELCRTLRGHAKWVTSLSWEPFHRDPESRLLASSSKDGTIRIWDTARSAMVWSGTAHTAAVNCVRWGGEGYIYSASQDRSIIMWEAATGKLIRVFKGHGHWVNSLCLTTDHVLRSGPFNHAGEAPAEAKDAQRVAQERYAEALKNAPNQRETLFSCSDDFTLFLWDPTATIKPLSRMTGHQQPVNFVSCSPDGKLVASASFDGSVRLWSATSGKFQAVLRGHVQSVYQVCWSADSRLLVSSSKDSTLKVWDARTKKLKMDLPGHADEVFAVDWSPDGRSVASGGKDKVLKIWQH